MPRINLKKGLRRAVLAVLAAVGLGPTLLGAEGGDDAYRFGQGAGQPQRVELRAISDGVCWSWASPAVAGWDTVLLGVRLKSPEGDTGEPWVEATAGSLRIRQYLERGAHGLRWLNLTGLRAQLASATPVALVGHGVELETGTASLRVLTNRLDLKGRILILAPHPDDAEIAAFGLYAQRNATIVTVTCGNAGDSNYRDQFQEPAEQYRFKGFLRAVDSVTVPWQGGIPPARCFNLGYFDARLQTMHAKPTEVVPEMYGPNTDVSPYRKANLSRLLGTGPRTNTWAHLVEDLVKVLEQVKPTLIVMPHPVLDSHRDHAFTAVAAVEALRRWKGSATFLLYTNHANENLYPYGPPGTPAPLPPWAGRELPGEGFYAHPVDPGMQRRKLFALESMHDLRLSPAEQGSCLSGGVKTQRDDYPRVLAVDYFRRAPRPEELFFVFQREGVTNLIQDFLENLKD